MFTAILIVKAKRGKKNKIVTDEQKDKMCLTYITKEYCLATKRNQVLTHVVCAVCLVTQSYPTLCDPMDCSPPGSSVHGDSPGKNTGVGCHALLQGIFPTQGSKLGLPHCRLILYYLSHKGSPRILEWVAYPFSNGSS